MLTVTASMRVFVAREPTDMRKGFDGLGALVVNIIDEDPQSGHLFLFINRRRNRAKILGWTGTGYFIFYKRIERGHFVLRDQANGKPGAFEVTPHELGMILEGIDLRGIKRQAVLNDLRRSSA